MKTTMKDLHETERPYEKCLLKGAGALTDAELLAAVLRTGSKGETAVGLAGRILKIQKIPSSSLTKYRNQQIFIIESGNLTERCRVISL